MPYNILKHRERYDILFWIVAENKFGIIESYVCSYVYVTRPAKMDQVGTNYTSLLKFSILGSVQYI